MKFILKNWKIFVGLFILIFMSLIILSSLSMNQKSHLDAFYRQSVFVVISIVVLFLFSNFDYRILKNNSILIVGFYAACVGLLGLLLIIGTTTRGIAGWFRLGFFNIQPVEFMKIALILILAKYLSTRNNEIWSWRTIITSGIFMAIPCLLALLQPDLGSCIIMFFIWVAMLIVCGLKLKHLLLMMLIVSICGFVGFKYVLRDYQRNRLISFVNPNVDPTGLNYNSRQSMIAVGSGRVLGKGLGWGTQTQLQFLPESRTDFIFASIAEELGLVGAVIIMVGFGLIFSYLIDLSIAVNNNFAKLFLLGILVKISIEMIINVGVNLGVLPVIGIALPFVSLGGSHLLADCVALGWALNASK